MNWEIISTIVSVIQILVSIVLILSVLMQSAKKEGMSGIVGGASETFFGKNKGRTLDSKFAVVTTVCAILFLVTSVFLSFGLTALEAAPEEVPGIVETVPETDVETVPEVEGEEAPETEGETAAK